MIDVISCIFFPNKEWNGKKVSNVINILSCKENIERKGELMFSAIAIRDVMFLRMQDFDFTQMLSNMPKS